MEPGARALADSYRDAPSDAVPLKDELAIESIMDAVADASPPELDRDAEDAPQFGFASKLNEDALAAAHCHDVTVWLFALARMGFLTRW
jgi:hypothetical protein